MLVRFVIDPGAIDNSTTPAQIRRLLEKWERFGVLVYPARNDTVVWSATLGRLNPAVRKRWMVALQMVSKNHRSYYRWYSRERTKWAWRSLRTPEAVASGSGHFEVALVGGSGAAILDIPEGESRLFGQVEGLRLRDVDAAEWFADSERLSTEPILAGEEIEAVWGARFRRLAKYAADVVVVDQHAVGSGQIEGVFRLLRFLDRDSVGCNVTIYSTIVTGGESQGGDVESKVRRQAAGLRDGGVRCVRVKLFEREGFRIYAHDRHVRFDRSVFRIGRGVRIFAKKRGAEATDVALTTLAAGGLERKEADLDGRVTRTKEFCVRLGRNDVVE